MLTRAVLESSLSGIQDFAECEQERDSVSLRGSLLCKSQPASRTCLEQKTAFLQRSAFVRERPRHGFRTWSLSLSLLSR